MSNRPGSTSREDKEVGSGVVQLVPTSAIDRTERARKEDSRSSSGYRSVRLGRQQQKHVNDLPDQVSGNSSSEPAILFEGADRFVVVADRPDQATQESLAAIDKETTKGSSDSRADLTDTHGPAGFLPETKTMANGPSLQTASLGPAYQAAQCYQIFQIAPTAVVLFWRLQKIDDWMAPLLGAACKEFLVSCF